MSNASQPSLTELLTSFLHKHPQVDDLGTSGFEVTPYEVGPVQPLDAGLAWREAVAVADYLVPDHKTVNWPMPPHWPILVTDQEPALALAFCFGNFPQLVRNFQLLLHKRDVNGLQLNQGRPLAVPALVDWADQVASKQQLPQVLLALGGLRLARNFDQAAQYVQRNEARIPAPWRVAWDNEKAALAWHQGQAKTAIALWNDMESTVPVLFNRGMAELFLGQSDKGRALLNEAIAKLPDTSAWHHLARLYALLGSSK